MNPQLVPLVQLQSLDLRGTEIQEQRRKIPDMLKDAERTLKQATEVLDSLTSSFETNQKERRELERNLEAQEEHIRKLKGRVTEIKKNTEYQAHLFEIQLAEKKKGEIEEQILLLMEEIERQMVEVKASEKNVAEAKKVFAEEKDRIQTLDDKLAVEFSELEGHRTRAAKAVDPALLSRYEKLKSIRKDLAVVRVHEGTCSGCRLQLAPQLVAEVKRAQDLLACTFCQRMLYYEGEVPVESLEADQPLNPASEGVSKPV